MRSRLLRIGLAVGLGISLTAVLVGLLAWPAPARADMLCVHPAGGQGCAYTTIQAAVDAAAPGDVISITAGTYFEHVVITQPLTFIGAGAANTIVDGSSTGRVFSSTSDLELANLTVQNGYSTESGGGLYTSGALTMTIVNVLSNTVTGLGQGGGGAYAAGPVTLIRGVFRNNQVSGLIDWGGGLLTMAGGIVTDTQFISNTAWDMCGGALIFGKAVIANALFQYNQANFTVGGGLCALDDVTLADTQFLSNTAAGRGGGLLANANATLSGGLFAGNQSTYNAGGGLYATGALMLTDVSVLSNTAVLTGGGVYASGPAVLSGGLFQNNRCTDIACFGGGLAVSNTLVLTDTQFISNTAGDGGGGIYVSGKANIADGLFQGNDGGLSGYGGGLASWDDLALTNTVFLNNTARGGGGAMVFYAGVTLVGGRFENNKSTGITQLDGGGGLLATSFLTSTNTQFISNTAARNGGGVYAAGPTTFQGNLFENNQTTGSGAGWGGGGLYVNGPLSLTSTQFLGNRSAQDGGALYHFWGDVGLFNALFAGSSAAGNGSALFLALPGQVSILHTTIASPIMGAGAAIYVKDGNVGITNTLIASYTTAIEVAGGSVASDYNLFFNAPTSLPIGSHSLTGINPLFVNPLAGDYHLAFGSPAGAAGIDLGVTTDLDGNPRPIPPSLGAYNAYSGPVYEVFLPVTRR